MDGMIRAMRKNVDAAAELDSQFDRDGVLIMMASGAACKDNRDGQTGCADMLLKTTAMVTVTLQPVLYLPPRKV